MAPPPPASRSQTAPPPPLPFEAHRWTALSRCGTGEGGRKGQSLPGWALFSGPFAQGEAVHVERKSNVQSFQAEVIGPVDPEAADRQGLQPVRVSDGSGDTVHVEPRKMARVLPAAAPRVLLMADTTCFRRVAKTQVGSRDAVLEIGSAFGDCTRLLSLHSAATIGVDLSEDFVKESRRLFPECRFEWLDMFEEPARLDALWAELGAKGERLKIFVDIGGDRAAADVCRVLAALGAAATRGALSPSLVVVKSRELARAAEAADCGPDGVLADPAAWWGRAARPPPPKSSLQEKRKHSRGRRAMWTNLEGDEERLRQAKASGPSCSSRPLLAPTAALLLAGGVAAAALIVARRRRWSPT